MKSKLKWITAGVLLIIIVGITGYFVLHKNNENTLKQNESVKESKLSTSVISTNTKTLIVYYSLTNSTEKVATMLKEKILSFDEIYEGTKTFYSKKISEIFKDKVCNKSYINNDSIGISQNEVDDISYKLDLTDKEWFIYNDNYGTTEEKKFVKYFSENIDKLKKRFDQIFLIRNERELPIYSFSSGERFEPDYLLILINNNSQKSKQYQIFIEPKGNHLLEQDKWKEELLLSLKKESIPITKFIDNKEYLIWGFPFFNKEYKMEQFDESMKSIIEI